MSVDATLFDRLLDDAAVFPPGSLPLAAAVPAYDVHRGAPYARLVGPFVLAASDLDALSLCLAGRDPGSFTLSMTVPLGEVADALARVAAVPAVDLAAIEVALAPDEDPTDLAPTLAHVHPDRVVHVEVPRDARRQYVIDVLAECGHRAKLRTGGVRADLHPDDGDLATAVHALVAAGVPFKATAGLHHAVRTTDAATGFEQHGFLNLLTATSAALGGADVDTLATLLAERDGARVREAVTSLERSVRDWFGSFGTCSVTDPVAELVALDLLPRDHLLEEVR